MTPPHEPVMDEAKQLLGVSVTLFAFPTGTQGTSMAADGGGAARSAKSPSITRAERRRLPRIRGEKVRRAQAHAWRTLSPSRVVSKEHSPCERRGKNFPNNYVAAGSEKWHRNAGRYETFWGVFGHTYKQEHGLRK